MTMLYLAMNNLMMSFICTRTRFGTVSYISENLIILLVGQFMQTTPQAKSIRLMLWMCFNVTRILVRIEQLMGRNIARYHMTAPINRPSYHCTIVEAAIVSMSI